MRRLTWIALTSLVLAPAARADTYTVTLDPSIGGPPVSGRVILFFVTETGRRWERTPPMSGPFWSRPQPIASIAVVGLEPGGSVFLKGSAVAFPGSLDDLEGTVRVQAILDSDHTERSHLTGPGNVHSAVQTVELSAGRDDRVTLRLDRRIEPEGPPEDRENLKWIELRSERLSAFYGRSVYHRAGVALPKGYLDPAASTRKWPAVYVIPGFGSRHHGAARYAKRFETADANTVEAVHIVLDPESPLGHHGFVDSPNHGPRGTALVEELIGHLESTFRLIAEPEARIVTGHSSGGWSSLWLQLEWPEVFGACWASAPDPVDFSAFQMCDLYRDQNIYVDAGGGAVPSFRDPSGPGGETVVRMTVRQECRMEYAVHPLGGSGEQWDAWEAMFSPRDPRSGYPRPMFDARTGRIDRAVVEHWRKFDISERVTSDWARYGPIVTGRIRLACGTLDSFYLERAVERLKANVERLAGEQWGPGYILLVPGATHDSLHRHIRERWAREMGEYLEGKGLRHEDTKARRRE